MSPSADNPLAGRLERLNALGVALSAEHDPTRLLEQILVGAKELTRADGGTIYSVSEDDGVARFEIVRNDSLGLAMGGAGGAPVSFPPVPLYLEDGRPNHGSVVAHAVLNGETVNIADAYAAAGFDFDFTRAFDARTGYRSQSFLTVPMRNHEGEVRGVLQLINARGPFGGVVPFSEADRKMVESLASQAATAATKHELLENTRALFEAFVKLIAAAIDEKSPYTSAHCQRVPELTMMLAEAAHRTGTGPLAEFTLTDADRYELRLAAWLHDCGKITTPEWVMDKATKLQCLYDRIDVIVTRFAAARAQAEIAWLRGALSQDEYEARVRALDADLEFLRQCNRGGEFLSDEACARIEAIARGEWTAPDGTRQPLLTADEVKNLSIRRGTLNAEERQIINNHVSATIRMLESLPYTKNLRRIPEFAGGHHERIDGAGYPKGLTREQMSVQARILAIADVFEALTSPDRPYKRAYKLSEAMRILERMKDEGHVDPDLYDVFLREGVWSEYAERYMAPAQRDRLSAPTPK